MKLIALMEQPASWEEARSLLQSSPLASTDFTKILDRYSDSNWGNHMLGDLYRNQGLESLKVRRYYQQCLHVVLTVPGMCFTHVQQYQVLILIVVYYILLLYLVHDSKTLFSGVVE